MRRINVYIILIILMLVALKKSVFANGEIAAGDINFSFSSFQKNAENSDFPSKWHEIDFRPKYENDLTSNIHVFLEGKMRHNFNSSLRKRYILNEGYFDFYGKNLDIRLGRQVVSWGRADTFRPTDQFKIYDYTDITKQDEEGVIGLKIGYFLKRFDLEGVLVPAFNKHILDFSGKNRWNPLPLQQGNLKVMYEEDITSEPPKSISSSQFGFRLNHQGEDVDYAFSYSITYDRAPVSFDTSLQSLDLSANEVVYTIQPEYHKLKTLGFDWAFAFYDYGLRGEMAYTFTEDKKGEKPDIDDPYFQFVTGMDRNFDRVIGDISIFILAQYALDKELPLHGEENNVEHSFKHFFRQMVLLNSEIKKDETKKLILKWMYNTEKKDYMFQPEFKIMPPTGTDGKTSREIYLRADILSGCPGTFFGTFSKNDRIEVGIKVYF